MSALRTRLATAADMPRLAELWEQQSGWGALAPHAWNLLVLSGPHRSPEIIVAEGDEGIVAQLILHHTRIVCDGEILEGLRPFAAIVSPSWRTTQLGGVFSKNHPLRSLIDHSLSLPGADVIHSMPDPRFVRFLANESWADILRFPLWSMPLDAPAPLPASASWFNYEFDDRLGDLTGAEISELCFVYRDPGTMEWKKNATGQQMVGVERDGALAAVVACRFHGDRQWQIEDLVAVDSHARGIAIAAAVEAGRAWRSGGASPEAVKAAILVTPTLEPTLRDIGFHPDDYVFAFLVAPLGRDRPMLNNAEDWYVSAAD